MNLEKDITLSSRPEVSGRKVFLKISLNSKKNTYARASF